MDDQELNYRLYVTREDQIFHASFTQELDFYSMVKTGDIERVKKLKNVDFTKQPGLGSLSKNQLQSTKYHFVIATAMISRYCIEGGMEHELAYNASDLYINKVDCCNSTKEVAKLQYDMILYYTTQMHNLRTAKVYSLPITKCIDYIYNNLHTQICVHMLCVTTGLSEGYLSRLFKQETGVTITDYIRKCKLNTAKNMLVHSNYSISAIAETLCFTSESYFIKVFKRYVGSTPAIYRKYDSMKLEF